MIKPAFCPSCGAAMKDGDSCCPRCLLSDALQDADSIAHRPGFLDDLAIPIDDTAAGVTIPPHGNRSAMIGRYKLLEQIGEGGFGVVWMAEQREPIKRRVALKILKLGMDTKQVVARFEAERQALAMMAHDNIAKILDAGATELGRPYFVMELVRGIPITQYCDQEKLATQARLDLFTKVCQAIHHAHQKGIIHRDIKPSNILVTLHDGVPVPKVIDFGIAKATQGELTDKTMFTAFEQFMGTPAYMSPEQAEMSGLDIDTRSDIYSLGVLLYELLTGHPPFDPSELAKAGMEEIRRTIREVEPPRPSHKLARLPAEVKTTTAQRRGVEPGKLAHQLKGDLDCVVMKCLEKDRSRRYDSASSLAADIRRHVDGEPVEATPPSVVYRFCRAVRNYRTVAAAMAVILTLIVVSAAAWHSFTKQSRQRDILSSLQAADRHFADGNTGRGLCELARLLRLNPLNRAAQERLLNELRMKFLLIPMEEKATPEEIVEFGFDLDPQIARKRVRWNLLTASNAGPQTIRLHSANSGAAMKELKVSSGVIRAIAICSEAGLIAAAASNEVTLWNAASTKPLKTLKASGRVISLEFDPHRYHLVSGTAEGLLETWDIEKSDLQMSAPAHKGGVTAIRAHPKVDGAMFTGGEDGMVRVWLSGSSTAIGVPHAVGNNALERAVEDIRFRRGEDLDLLLARVADGTKGVYGLRCMPSDSFRDCPATDTLPSLLPVTQIMGRPSSRFHGRTITATNISPDGKLLATASEDMTARVWDIKTFQPITTNPLLHPETVTSVSFSPDSKRIVTTTSGRKTRVWDVETGIALTDWIDVGKLVFSASFSKDGREIHTSSGTAWEIHVANEKCPDWLPAFAEAVCGQYIDAQGRLLTLPHERASAIWQALPPAAKRQLENGRCPMP